MISFTLKSTIIWLNKLSQVVMHQSMRIPGGGREGGSECGEGKNTYQNHSYSDSEILPSTFQNPNNMLLIATIFMFITCQILLSKSISTNVLDHLSNLYQNPLAYLPACMPVCLPACLSASLPPSLPPSLLPSNQMTSSKLPHTHVPHQNM